MSKKSVHDNAVDSVDDEIKSVDPTTPIRCIALALMDEGKDAGLPDKPVEEQVSTLVDKKHRETWDNYSRCALYQK